MTYPNIIQDINDIETKHNTEISNITTQIKTDLENYLPLSGGIMTGIIKFKNNHANNYEIYTSQEVGSGVGTGNYGLSANANSTEFGRGACWVLRDNSADNAYPGSFFLGARNNDVALYLNGRTDGTLIWNGQHIIRIVTNYKSGNNWYRKYSDGWIEQGGFVSASASTLADKNFTISLITSFTTTTYSFSNVIVLTAATGNWGAGACALKSKSTSSVVVIGEGAGGTSPVTGIWWYACGY